MPTRHHAHLAVAAATASLASVSSADVSSPASSPLLTPQHQEVERLAASLRNDPAIKAAHASALKRFEQAKSATLPDGKKTLAAAVDELVSGMLLIAANNDPGNPKVIWNLALPYAAGGVKIAGTRNGGDSPDRIYRSIGVSPKYRYEIKVARNAHPSLDYSFEALPFPSLWGQPIVALQAKDIDVGKDGTFTITADSTPANGRRNHLQLPPTTTTIFIRDTLADWHTQLPNVVSVRRVDDAQVPPRTRDEIVNDAIAQIDGTVAKTLGFIEGRIWNENKQANIITPFPRLLDLGMPGSVFSGDRFSIRDDEALVFTLDPITAKYLSVEVTDLWMVSAAYSNRSTSLSNAQAKPNTDGSFTYVLSKRDPGVYNWLDSGGMNDGFVVVRWELLAQKVSVDKALRDMRKVKLTEVTALVPADHPRVTPDERQQLLDAREAGYKQRLGAN